MAVCSYTGSIGDHCGLPRNKLVVFDFAVSRGGPGDDHAPEVFYEFKIRNESTIDVKFILEFVVFSDLPIAQN